MKKIIFLFCFIFVSFSSANDTPLRLSYYTQQDAIFHVNFAILEITALDNNVIIKDIILNRGNCKVNQLADTFSRKMRKPFPVKLNYGTTIKRGTSCSKILEAEVATENGNYTFNW